MVTDFGLDLTGWTLSRANGISADGRTFAGYGTNPDGHTEAWIVHIPPPPGVVRDLLVGSTNSNEILRYDGQTGAFVGAFASGSGLDGPRGLAFGPDGNLYLASNGEDVVRRYQGQTGDFIDVFASGGGLDAPTFAVFVPSPAEADCNHNGIPDGVDIAGGTSVDCQPNGVPDECDIASGLEDDCNENQVPDSCEPDPDLDRIPDECDNCPDAYNPGQVDFDGDGLGDACDPDLDGDGVPNEADVCVHTPLGTAVNSEGRPLGDIDEDCDTDLEDYALFQQGFTGPLP